MNRQAWHPVAVARDPPAQLVAAQPRSSWPECAVASAAAAAAMIATPPRRALASTRSTGASSGKLLGTGDARVDAAERRPVLDEHPPARAGRTTLTPPQARRELERRALRVERRLAQVEVDAAEDDAHRRRAAATWPCTFAGRRRRRRRSRTRRTSRRRPSCGGRAPGPTAQRPDEHDDDLDAAIDETLIPASSASTRSDRSESRVRRDGRTAPGREAGGAGDRRRAASTRSSRSRAAT